MKTKVKVQTNQFYYKDSICKSISRYFRVYQKEGKVLVDQLLDASRIGDMQFAGGLNNLNILPTNVTCITVEQYQKVFNKLVNYITRKNLEII